MELLLQRENEKFYIDHDFDVCYLAPIARYVLWKLESNQWDDYNELYHASRLIEQLKTHSDIWFNAHVLLKDNSIIGVLLIVGGKIRKLEKKYEIENEDQSLLLKYFHITDKGHGYGSIWLNDVILPFYQQKNFSQIYVNSSHKLSFPFYERMGRLIAKYEQQSDNNLYRREGSCFLIDIGKKDTVANPV